MNKSARLEAKNSAAELEDTGLQRHYKNGSEPERRPEQDAAEQSNDLNRKLDRADRGTGKTVANENHERVPRTTTQPRHHIDDGRDRADGLAEERAKQSEQAGGCREAREEADPQV